ncbi:poly polymerase catalytic domain-containing protein, partial [Fimicolochytrium jonesii]|uniref:poly polymerase catalytic domain-containing protein n=1 Tax=Fimicolochytrium jonesii TaxID=1396493 RepID=UPI0022FDFB01
KHSLASDTNSTQAETSSKKLKLTVTSDSAVDPRAGVPDSTRVHGAVGNRYDATLALVDTRKNMFYKLQVLTNGSRVWLFKAYGPIGTDGVCETKPYYDTHSAVSEFERLFLDKTKNQWSARRRFVKQPKAYYMMDVGYTSDSLGAGKPDIHEIDFSQSSTTLSPEVADLIKLIFDVGKMKETMFELEIDTEKMPLGNISKSQLNRGFEVLKSIGDVLTKRENGLIPQDDAAGMLAHRSNEFYTLVPHIGRTLPAIDSTALLVKKTELVETLVQMEITTRLLGSEQIGAQQSPLDFHYAQLKCDMRVLSPASDEYQLIQTYVTNSQGATHSHFKINIDYILVLNRDSETERFAKYQAWENRYLLWHGSRLTNWTGILSQGLKIAPPSAPVNGYMFGKGTYHANSITKSAGYCMASPAKPDAILILNEVALGRIHKFDSATYMEKPHRGSDSTHGVGMYQPSGEVVMRDGVVVPSGVLEKKGAYRSLMYDEFIVYDEGQSRMRYLVRL